VRENCIPGEVVECNYQKWARSVVVTGIGLISPVGIGTEETWQAILNGRNGIAPITLFSAENYPCRFAGEVKGFVPEDFIERKDVKKIGRFIQFAMAAARYATTQAAIHVTPENAERVGVYVGSGVGAFEVIEREHSKLIAQGPSRVSPFFITASIANLAGGRFRSSMEPEVPISHAPPHVLLARMESGKPSVSYSGEMRR
jgi:3-oxoacyl-[acyl-carrier-protein] synthase II